MKRLAALLLSLAAAFAALVAVPTAAHATLAYHFCYGGNSSCPSYVESSTLNPPWTLPPGQWNSSYRLTFQSDCNLVFYDPGYPGGVSWSSGTYTIPRPCTLRFQPDDNMVIYDSGGHPRWATNTYHAGRTAEAFYMDNVGCFWLDYGLAHQWVNHSYCNMTE